MVGELSIPCPAGLSGGPLFRPGAPQMLTAMATENIYSTAAAEAIEEETRGGAVNRKTYHRIIEYGVALMLDPLMKWLDDHIPPHSFSGEK
jgi:hypothetical protein